ncbi:BCCT family transporter [Jiangella endophytica]|uniref:BCCT family transporter n=1 Tax=Jiangella endophytica TaxID=1623398 RepID=UPI000E355614|nr:BCCT family transporter [Jiangella endophytica]
MTSDRKTTTTAREAGVHGPDPDTPAAAERRPTDKVVFGVAGGIVLAFVIWGLANTDSLASASSEALAWVTHNAGWAFALTATGFVVFILWVAFSRYGRIPLGADDERPEFRTSSWIAMMFSAGMGIGLMFFGVNEPLTFFTTDPVPGTGEPESIEAMNTAMATTLFHWTLHPWAIYAVVGLAIAYGTFRRGRSQLISSVFTPLLGRRRVEGGFGRAINVFAIFATVFGTAASLGLGALQIGSGLQEVGWLNDVSTGLLVAIIAVLTFAFVASAVSGIERGIQWLSNTNMVLATVLAFFVFVAGPTIFVLNLIPTAIGDYFADLAEMAARTEASGGEAMQAWVSGWTIFYWAWWMSWTPFVGMFIARISRGRTIRQFVVGVLLVPSAVSVVWFCIFGGTAIDLQRDGADIAGTAENPSGQEEQLFSVLQHLPLTTIASVLVMLLVAIFFVSGADAASIVTGTLSQRGSIEPSRRVVVFWGLLMGAVAAIMLMIGEGGATALEGLENITILAGAPFMLVMVGVCVALAKDLRSDPLMLREDRGVEAVEQAVDYGLDHYDGEFHLRVGATNGDAPAEETGPPEDPGRRR